VRTVLPVTAGAGLVVVAGWVTGEVLGFRGPAFAWIAHFALMAWASPSVAALWPDPQWGFLRVRPWEPALYRRLGAGWYGRGLRAVGWERLMSSRRVFDGTRASLPALERQARTAEVAHTLLAIVGWVLVAVAAAFTAWDAVGWLTAANVVFHCYPVMLQRMLRARLAAIGARGVGSTASAPRMRP
jgi:hypothetical protein